ncbi:receptor homology region, transmembrane domain- and RING domain-containing protein 1 [Morus notabilis]|uniref:receptor homology region, transmembrane domain- and RING domain-containing protein 1 n=1 Tax=Morus notabilis TaxID=981085 RepID=UPI000CED7612|nr:receptor homology region, transmembrane domain- and RING domain-containing protein 1 [Morus notabilis]
MRGILLGLWLGLALNVIQFASSTILLRSLSMSFTDLPAKFAVGVNDSGICGALHVVNPLDACRSLSNDLRSTNIGGINFALIIRGECAFEDKVRNAQKAGFNAAIVYDNQDKGNLVYMMVNRENVSVHAVFISKRAGEILKENARGEDGECCIFPFNSETAWTVLAISFISFIVILAILMVAIFTPRRWLTSRGRNNLPRNVDVKMVEALPCFTFSSAHSSDCHAGETCAICLEDYKDGEILKVLPCRHEYHSSCVDSWLIKWGTFCPVCKHDMRTEYECSEVKRRTWL